MWGYVGIVTRGPAPRGSLNEKRPESGFAPALAEAGDRPPLGKAIPESIMRKVGAVLIRGCLDDRTGAKRVSGYMPCRQLGE